MERKLHLVAPAKRRITIPAIVGLCVFMAIGAYSVFKPPQGSTVASSDGTPPPPTDGFMGPAQKVESCNTIADDASDRAVVIAEGRVYLLASAGRLYCLRTDSVREASFDGRNYLCALDDRRRGQCAPIVSTH